MSVDIDHALVLEHLANQQHFFFESFDSIHDFFLLTRKQAQEF
jgi:hypothetical protein